MALIWCSISGHGFGHGAQLVPVLNELGRRIPSLKIFLRTTLPPKFFEDQLEVEWDISSAQQDVGCVQRGPINIDITQTWEEYERFHHDWDRKIAQEVEAMRAVQPDLVLSNISHLAVEAGVRGGYRTVALSSLSWDRVLGLFVTKGSEVQRKTIEHIRWAYQKAELMIRLTPGIPMEAFHHIADVGPIYSPPSQANGQIRAMLKVKPDERLVLVAFGGIPLESLPVDRIMDLHGYQFLIGGARDFKEYPRVVSTASLPFSFHHILAEADIVMTKPGYATIVQTVQAGIPIVYVRRYNFVDEQLLVDYAHRHVKAIELSEDQFVAGDWSEALEAVSVMSPPLEQPPHSGVLAAATLLEKFL